MFARFVDSLRVHTDDPALMRAQLSELTRQIPLFYLVICVNIGALAFNFYGSAPSYLTVWFPVIFISLCFGRAMMWFLRAGRHDVPDDPAIVAHRLKMIILLAFFMAIILTSWSVWLADYGGQFQKSHVAFFIAVTLISAMFSTLQFPTASYMALIVAGGTFIFRFGFGDRSMMAMTINFVPLMAVSVAMSLTYFRTLSDLMKSTADLKSAHEELKDLYGELAYHRDNLKTEVDKQTQELREQKLKLQVALTKERELNQLQNEFVSMVSHEFRTPLTIIDATARRVRNKADSLPQEQVEDRMDKIRGSVSRLANLVERTLDASRLASGKMNCEPVALDIASVINEVVARHREISPDWDITCSLGGLPDTIQADPRLCDHIFSNLIGNAVKYSGEARHVDVVGLEEKGCAVVSVQDFGIGIPKEEMPRLTERFFRASTSVGIQGTGIGLNLVRSLVDMHEGAMRFESTVGKGTTATVCLPISGPSAAHLAQENVSEAEDDAA